MRRCSEELPSASLLLLILQLNQLVTSMLLAFDELPAALSLLSCVLCLGLALLKDTAIKLSTSIFCALPRIFCPCWPVYPLQWVLNIYFGPRREHRPALVSSVWWLQAYMHCMPILSAIPSTILLKHQPLQLSIPFCPSALQSAWTGHASQEKDFPTIYLNLSTKRPYVVMFCPLEFPPASYVHLLILPISRGYFTGRALQPSSLEFKSWGEAMSTCSLHTWQKGRDSSWREKSRLRAA